MAFYSLAKGGRYDNLVKLFRDVITDDQQSTSNRGQQRQYVTGGVIYVDDIGTKIGKESYSRHDSPVCLDGPF